MGPGQGGFYQHQPQQQQPPQGMQQQGGQGQKCKAFDCNYNASEEYGGYCHNCFLLTTKHQAEKEKGIFFFLDLTFFHF